MQKNKDGNQLKEAGQQNGNVEFVLTMPFAKCIERLPAPLRIKVVVVVCCGAEHTHQTVNEFGLTKKPLYCACTFTIYVLKLPLPERAHRWCGAHSEQIMRKCASANAKHSLCVCAIYCSVWCCVVYGLRTA